MLTLKKRVEADVRKKFKNRAKKAKVGSKRELASELPCEGKLDGIKWRD